MRKFLNIHNFFEFSSFILLVCVIFFGILEQLNKYPSFFYDCVMYSVNVCVCVCASNIIFVFDVFHNNYTCVLSVYTVIE